MKSYFNLKTLASRSGCAPAALLTALMGTLLLGGCSHTPTVSDEPSAHSPPPLPEVVQVDDQTFDIDTLYALLVAEFAGNRERFDVMLNNYAQQATTTQDPEITARACRLARYLQDRETALAMATQWVELSPYNIEARSSAALELTEANQLMPAMKHAEFLMAQGHTSGLDAIAARALQINDPALTNDLLNRFTDLAASAPSHPPLYIGLSFLEQYNNQLDQALASVKKAQALEPESYQAAAQEIRILQQMKRDPEALTKLAALVEKNPNNTRLRLQYARSLIRENIVLAEQEFLTLQKSSANDPDILLTVALIQYELKKYSEAKSHFLLLTDDAQRQSTAHAYLGRIALIENNPSAAVRHLKAVGPGSEYLSAQATLAETLVNNNQAKGAYEHLTQQYARDDINAEAKEGLVLLQSQILNRTGQTEKAIARLSQAMNGNGARRLLYARAMLYTQMGNVTLAETDLKSLIDEEPNHAAALNALGYTLTDYPERRTEAYGYIQRAYALTPEDPAVIDSLGWAEYLRGNTQKALSLLKRAMQAMPDHEIAAHLGEVLWATGEQDAARRIWQQGLELKPDSPTIHKTLKRLKIELSGQP